MTSAENRIAAYRKDVDAVADDLARRQLFIEKMVKTYVGDLPADAKAGETVSDSSEEASKTVDKVSAMRSRGRAARPGRGPPARLRRTPDPLRRPAVRRGRSGDAQARAQSQSACSPRWTTEAPWAAR